MTKPNVDWEAIKHPTTTRQDNMRAVQLQLGGSAPLSLGDVSGDTCQPRPTQGTLAPPSGINDGRLSCGLSQVNPMPPWAYLQPDAELAKLAKESFQHPEQATWKPKRTVLSPDAVKQLSALVDNGMTYQEATMALQYRHLEGDTEFIDEPPTDEHSYSYVLWGRLGLTYGNGLIAHSRGPEGESSSHCCHNGECTGRCQGA